MNEEKFENEGEIKDAQTVADEEFSEDAPKKKRNGLMIELGLFFILGLLIGIAVKTEAAKVITIGHSDYQMKIMKQDYDINKLQVELEKKRASELEAQNGEVVPEGQEGAGVPGGESQEVISPEQ